MTSNVRESISNPGVDTQEPRERAVPSDVAEMCNAWMKWYHVWNTIHYVVGGLSAIGAVLVAAKVPWVSENNTTVTVAVAICTAMVTFYRTNSKAVAYITAWRTLKKAINVFRSDNSYSVMKLREVMDNCEMEIIAKTDL